MLLLRDNVGLLLVGSVFTANWTLDNFLLAMKSNFFNCEAEGLFDESKVKHFDTNVLNSSDHFDGFVNDFGGCDWIEKIAL